MDTNVEKKLRLSLLLLRIGVFIVMFMWTLDKFVNPAHSARILENFYSLPGADAALIHVLGAAELVLLFAFLGGLMKKWTYGTVLLLHTLSTLSPIRQYLAPFDNLLFFAAWPMLAACIALFLLRDEDRLWTLGSRD